MSFRSRSRSISSKTIITVFVLAWLLAPVDAADPMSDSQSLYLSVVRHRAALMDLLGSDAAPQIKAILIEKYVSTPVNMAGGTWIDRSFAQGEALYRPFSPCLYAATALTDFASRVKAGSAPFVAEAAAYLREQLTSCQTTLGNTKARPRSPEMGSRLPPY